MGGKDEQTGKSPWLKLSLIQDPTKEQQIGGKQERNEEGKMGRIWQVNSIHKIIVVRHTHAQRTERNSRQLKLWESKELI